MRSLTAFALLITFALAASLIKMDLFGSQSLSSYCLYTISASIAAMIIFITIKKTNTPGFPLPLVLFTLLIIYIFCHGMITHTMGPAHFLWCCYLLLLLCTYRFGNVMNYNSHVLPLIAAKGIMLLALLESVDVLLQCIHLLPSQNEFFLCTGMGSNPNTAALFLAVSLPAVFISSGKKTAWLLPVIIIAIAMLQCRTAYIITLLFFTHYYWQLIKTFFAARLKIDHRLFSAIIIAVLVVTILSLAFLFKENSTASRLQIWKTSAQLITQKPVTGHGFGLFEKYYNLYAAQLHPAINDHINMPYNDFIELSIEGGLPAALCWVLFLVSFTVYCIRYKKSLFPILAIFIIQVTNFGFQSIPVFSLFLLYAGASLSITKETGNNVLPGTVLTLTGISFFKTRFYRPILITACIIFCIHQLRMAAALFKQNEVALSQTSWDAVDAYEKFQPLLYRSPVYHENYGDAYMSVKQFKQAKEQYLQALQSCTNASLLGKAGWCYQQLNQFDSSEYYYTIARNMMPHKFLPRYSLLCLYQQKKDTARLLSTAMEIVSMPVKKESREVERTRLYAKNILNTIKR